MAFQLSGDSVSLRSRIGAALKAFARADASDDSLWSNSLDHSVASASGSNISQQTTLNVSAALACVSMLAEDVAKLTQLICRWKDNGAKEIVKDHYLSKLFMKPNDWQSGFEFREMMQFSLIMRGNAYALKLRDQIGRIIKLVPVNSDRVSLWEAPDGALYYRVTPIGLHEAAQFRGQPFLIPAEDMLHIRGFSANGLLGASRISLSREAIGLAIGYERQAANWMSNGSRPSGVLTTDSKLTSDAAKRMSDDWRSINGGLGNNGKVAVLEQGLKFEKISLSAVDLEFIASRKFQLEEIARIFRVPPHKIGILDRSTNNNIVQQSQDYVNDTITGYTTRWSTKIDSAFDLQDEGVFCDWDYSILTRADMTTRYNNYRTGVMSMFLKPDEARIDDGKEPLGGEADKLQRPTNMADAGSQSTGTKADDGGRPEGSTENKSGET